VIDTSAKTPGWGSGKQRAQVFVTMTFDVTDTRDDRELLQSARNGDQAAFGQIAGKNYQSCLRVATSILMNSTEAEDQVQQALRKAFQHINQYLGEADFVIWLLRIVVNECRMFLRHKKRANLVYLSHSCERSWARHFISHTVDPEHETIAADMVHALRTEIRRIPPLLRQVLLLRDIDGLTMPEIADRLRITLPAAKSRLMRGRAELRKRVELRFGPSKHMMPVPAAAMLPARASYTSTFVN
jgi:RNA polymerase sigma-70 factor (ECF subfamily)